jgi:antibiotic biosynthesis monooxygenase (ABM) superfamily enzyme
MGVLLMSRPCEVTVPETANADSAGALPVTVVLSRRPAPGREHDLLEWAGRIVEAASRFPGHLGAQVFPPDAPDHPDLVVAFSFSTAAELSDWEHSDERRVLLEAAKSLVVGEARAHTVSGFEGIFAYTPGQAVTPPPRWKTAIVIGLAIYPMSLLVGWLLAPHVADWNVALRVLVTTLIVVPYMSWLGVPYLSRWLGGWLRRG